MEKIVIICPSCSKKMKIINKVAKYRCPHCSEIYQYTRIKKFFTSIDKYCNRLLDGILSFPRKISKRYRDALATAKYMKQLKKNMKNDPNWSNYRKQQEEEKRYK